MKSEQLENIRRALERGRDRAFQTHEDSSHVGIKLLSLEFIDTFTHCLDELERAVKELEK